MSFIIPPQKVQDHDFDWKTIVELRLLEKMIFSPEDYEIFKKELTENIKVYSLSNATISSTLYTYGRSKTI